MNENKIDKVEGDEGVRKKGISFIIIIMMMRLPLLFEPHAILSVRKSLIEDAALPHSQGSPLFWACCQVDIR